MRPSRPNGTANLKTRREISFRLRGLTLIELIVIIAIIALLIAILLPALGLAREYAAEALCQSNLRQLTVMLKTYCNDNDHQFPNPLYLYHSQESFKRPYGPNHVWTCRWHDEEIGPAGPLMRKHKELEGHLIPYLKNPKVLLCKTGARAYLQRGCNHDPNKPRRPQPVLRHSGGSRGRGRGRGGGSQDDEPNEPIALIPQYSYTMNGYLYRTLTTLGPTGIGPEFSLDTQTIRQWRIRRESQVTRSPSEVFAFGEENSWPVNKESGWPSPYNLSGPWGGTQKGTMTDPSDFSDRKLRDRFKVTGAITIGSLDIGPSYTLWDSTLDSPRAFTVLPETDVGDAFATYHRPGGGDLNTGHSYVSMLDGHVRKITVADQLRRSRQVQSLPPSSLGPGGNLHLAWPLDIPPLAGWDNQ